MLTKEQISQIEKIIGLKFKDSNLISKAFIHRSYLNESENLMESNERLEFLGDSILQFLSSEMLYNNHPTFSEGELTNLRSKIVNTDSLAEESIRLGFSQFLFISKGELKAAKESRHILANTFEAVLGAIYLTHGIKICEEYLTKNLFYKVNLILETGLLKDYKSMFQEFSQEEFAITPNYKVLSEEGPDHSKSFTVGIYLNERKIEEGKGTSKRSAQQEAALMALKKFGKLEAPKIQS